jgi:hypothetical protein
MLFRILTEDINELKTEKTIELVGKFFAGFTLIKGIGHWQGKPENCLIFEIQTDDKKELVFWLANQIKLQNNQDSVLVQEIKSTAKFI